MFNRSKKGGDGVRKSIQKLLDPKRDSDKRLSNLRHIIDNAQEIADQQLLFCQFYSHIYYVFYENFLLVEQKLKQRLSWAVVFDLWTISHFILYLLETNGEGGGGFSKIFFLLKSKKW